MKGLNQLNASSYLEFFNRLEYNSKITKSKQNIFKLLDYY